MAIGTFHRSQPRPHFLPGANLQVSGRPQRDVGIIGTFNGRILAGEVETNPADFTQEHITHDISTNAGIGADIHLMAAIHPISAANREIAETQGNSHDMELRAPTSPNLQ
ncbi:hypothetical protein [Streptomyces hirsutus]|uniref:hypothetical protein n=1 Tax=Streptomyces hirsutus TaxID=35620 RepID=UPI00331AF067